MDFYTEEYRGLVLRRMAQTIESAIQIAVSVFL